MDGAAARTEADGHNNQAHPADVTAEVGPAGGTTGSGARANGSGARANGSGAPADDSTVGEDGLTGRERAILGFERQWWKYAGAKEQAIKEAFGLSATRYYQILNALVDRSEALRVDPLLVKRLRRLRASRQKARAARKLGITIT